jgi:hypothetical protein
VSRRRRDELLGATRCSPGTTTAEELSRARHPHPVDFAYTSPEIEALFRYAHEHDVNRGGRYDARSAAINVWSHHWLHDATREESDIIGTFYFHWNTPALWEVETD